MSDALADITQLSRAQLEEHYVFILSSLGVLIRRQGGSVILNDDDVSKDGGMERLWIEDLQDAKNGLRLSLRPHERIGRN